MLQRNSLAQAPYRLPLTLTAQHCPYGWSESPMISSSLGSENAGCSTEVCTAQRLECRIQRKQCDCIAGYVTGKQTGPSDHDSAFCSFLSSFLTA